MVINSLIELPLIDAKVTVAAKCEALFFCLSSCGSDASDLFFLTQLILLSPRMQY